MIALHMRKHGLVSIRAGESNIKDQSLKDYIVSMTKVSLEVWSFFLRKVKKNEM
jgi:hypothetical protein